MKVFSGIVIKSGIGAATTILFGLLIFWAGKIGLTDRIRIAYRAFDEYFRMISEEWNSPQKVGVGLIAGGVLFFVAMVVIAFIIWMFTILFHSTGG